jgi:hypothetical protein
MLAPETLRVASISSGMFVMARSYICGIGRQKDHRYSISITSLLDFFPNGGLVSTMS